MSNQNNIFNCDVDRFKEAPLYFSVEKTLVRNATVFPTNTTSFQVTWDLPEHAASVNRIEIRTSPRNKQPWIGIRNITAVSSAVVSGLQPGTEYSVLITSIDYTSRYSMGGDRRSVTVNATTCKYTYILSIGNYMNIFLI